MKTTPAKQKNPHLRLFAMLAIVAALFVAFYLQQGGWMMWSPTYNESNLRGLTRAQVAERLGPASFDPSLPFPPGSGNAPDWVNEASDGPLIVSYYQGWATCAITFKNDRVVSVRRNYK